MCCSSPCTARFKQAPCDWMSCKQGSNTIAWPSTEQQLAADHPGPVTRHATSWLACWARPPTACSEALNKRRTCLTLTMDWIPPERDTPRLPTESVASSKPAAARPLAENGPAKRAALALLLKLQVGFNACRNEMGSEAPRHGHQHFSPRQHRRCREGPRVITSARRQPL
jgi:hypothetical protein